MDWRWVRPFRKRRFKRSDLWRHLHDETPSVHRYSLSLILLSCSLARSINNCGRVSAFYLRFLSSSVKLLRISMPDHRSYQDPFYGWNVPKPISLCVQTLKECSSLPFEAIRKIILSKICLQRVKSTFKHIVSLLVSEAQVLNENATSPLETFVKYSKKYAVSFEQLMIIFNGFVRVLRLALKPPAAFLKPEVIIRFTLTIVPLYFLFIRYSKRIYEIWSTEQELWLVVIVTFDLDFLMLSSMSFIIFFSAISEH